MQISPAQGFWIRLKLKKYSFFNGRLSTSSGDITTAKLSVEEGAQVEAYNINEIRKTVKSC